MKENLKEKTSKYKISNFNRISLRKKTKKNKIKSEIKSFKPQITSAIFKKKIKRKKPQIGKINLKEDFNQIGKTQHRESNLEKIKLNILTRIMKNDKIKAEISEFDKLSIGITTEFEENSKLSLSTEKYLIDGEIDLNEEKMFYKPDLAMLKKTEFY